MRSDHPSMQHYQPTADETRFLTHLTAILAAGCALTALIIAAVVLLDLTGWRIR